MFDPDLIDKNPAAQLALKLLGESQLCEQQLMRFREHVLAGDPSESDAALMEAIREYRIKVANIQTLQELGIKYKETEL